MLGGREAGKLESWKAGKLESCFQPLALSDVLADSLELSLEPWNP